MTVVGELALWIALFLGLWGSAASVAGARLRRTDLLTSGRRALTAAAGMIALSALGLWTALLSHDFSLAYAAAHTTLNTPTPYLVAAFWAGPAGRMLFLALVLSAAGAVVAREARHDEPTVGGTIVATLATLLAVLVGVVCFAANPYDRVEWVPAEGQGLAPPLQTPLAAWYFVTTYAGYSAAGVVLALLVSASLVGHADRRWIAAVRRWCALCWLLLSVGIGAHMRWSYLQPDVAGFGLSGAAQLTTILVWTIALVGFVVASARDNAMSAARMWTRPRVVSVSLLALGLALVFTGVAGRPLWMERVVDLDPGETIELTDRSDRRWRFVSQGASRDEQPNHLSTSVALEVWHGQARAGFVSAERRQYLDTVQRPTYNPVARPGVISSPTADVYVVLAGLRGDTGQLRISFRPLVNAVWLGWLLVAAGGIALSVLAAPSQGTGVSREARQPMDPVAAGR